MATISDRILNTITGRNMETIKVPYEQLLSMIDDLFISEAETEDELNKIVDVCSKSAMNILFSTQSKYISKNGRYEILFQAAATGGSNNFWIHDLDTDKFFELDKSKHMKKLTKAIEVKVAQVKIDISTGKRKPVITSEPVQINIPVMGDLSQLSQLKELLDSGVINQEEFEIKKKQILNLDGSMNEISNNVEGTASHSEITPDKIAQIKIMCMNFIENFKSMSFSTSEKLANLLSISINSEIYFMYDDTLIGKEKIGFALTSTGIYYKPSAKELIITSYEEIRDCHNIYIRKSDIYAGSKKILTMSESKKYREALGNLISEIRDLLQ